MTRNTYISARCFQVYFSYVQCSTSARRFNTTSGQRIFSSRPHPNPTITPITMISIRNILVAIAFLSAAPVSFAAPAAESTALSQNNSVVPNNADATPTFDTKDDVFSAEIDGENDLDAREVLEILNNRAIKCGITSKPGRDCQYSACPPSEQCKVSAAGNCVYKNTTRPAGCDACKCYKTSM
jgi:hypothetical protein